MAPASGSVVVGGYFEQVTDDSKASAFFAVFRPGFTLATRGGAQAPVLQCYPNPARDHATVLLPADAAGRPLRLLDGLGREVRRMTIPRPATQATLDLRGLTPGLYLIRCGTATGRLVVQ